MLEVPNICFLNDIIKLSKSTLKEISTELNIPTDRSVNELAVGIWEHVRKNRALQRIAFEKYKDKILCGRMSVTWFLPSEEIRGCREAIIKNSAFNPFEDIRIPEKHELSPTPTLICGAGGSQGDDYYLRFIYKSGVTRSFYGTEMELQPTSSIATAYIDEHRGFVEVRTDHRKAKEIVSQLAELMTSSNHSKINFLHADIIAPFSHNVENIADALNGELIDAEAKPELLLEEVDEEQTQAVVQILSALESYFENEDVDKLTDELRQAREVFGDDLLGTPFTAIILAGLEKVGMGVSERDLRGTPLYDYLKPYLQHQGGFIRLKIYENGLEQSYTVRVGLSSKSVYFVTPSNENVIRFVRERLIHLD